MNFAVIVFPGSSGELDCYKAVEQTTGQPVRYVQHTETDLSSFDCIILPGGASYGDYLRSGALASLSPVVNALKEAAERGASILGIGNGFQILVEAQMLPGALLRNEGLKFRCHPTTLRVESLLTPFTSNYEQGEQISIPIAHGVGNYYCDEATLNELRSNEQIVFRYEGDNPNGSLDDIAGICNKEGNVLGMMPHPERAIDSLLGSEDGIRLFTSILNRWREQHGAATIG